MRTARLTLALLATTTLAGASGRLPAADGDVPAGVRELLDPVAVARNICGPTPRHRTEAFKPGVQLAAANAAAVAAEQSAEAAPPLWDKLGSLTWSVTTRSETAQRYFDQGLRLAYGFNHGEARRAFRAAQAADPACAMCYWGEAWVLGPNINQPMAAAAVEPAFAAVAKAAALASTASPREQAAIRALARRYSPDPAADRKALDAAYADGMVEAARAFPDDGEVQVLLADALMNLSPWDYWEADGATPKGRTAELVAALEAALRRYPDHPGAVHLYIHTVEASTTPERAEAHADRLSALMPGAGHIVHMPSHIYYRVGRYKDSLAANAAAAAADEAYLSAARADAPYAYGYYPHNVHFLLVSAQAGGDGPRALEAAGKLDRVMSDEVAREVGWVQAIKTAPYTVHAQFSPPETVLALPAPAGGFPFVEASWRYARAVALAAKGDVAAAEAEGEVIARLAEGPAFAELATKGVPAAEVAAIARHVVAGRIAQARGRHDEAAAAFREAAAVQARLPYMEPPFWYYPVDRSLGGALLAAGRPGEAAQAFRQSLVRTPNDAYALFGLAAALRAAGDAAGAGVAEARFREAWSGEGLPELGML